jgi:hypothetical protein
VKALQKVPKNERPGKTPGLSHALRYSAWQYQP